MKEIFDPDKEDRIKDRSLNGDNYYPEDYQADAPDWLFSEAKLAVYNITQQIRNDIHLGPEIDTGFGDSADDVREANKKGAGLLKRVLGFPIGLTMKAEHVMDKRLFNFF